MSVVNRMLQDIDRRRSEAGIDPRADADIRSVNPIASRSRQRANASRGRRNIAVAALLMLATAASLVALREWPLAAPAGLPEAQPKDVPPVLPISPAPGQTGTNALPSSAAALPMAAADVPAAAAAAAATEVQQPQPGTARASAARLKLSLKLSKLVADTPPPTATVKTEKPPIVAPQVTVTRSESPGLPVRQVASEETVRVARGLWNEGARNAAFETLRDALASAETARNGRATAMLARELARLLVADNRAQAALDLLKRLQNLFADDADAWALRGNAEQRLTLHPEASESYLAALRLRPIEGKWMIGAAISLAASGRQDEARAWVERARERGAITPAIGAYLQQLGIIAP